MGKKKKNQDFRKIKLRAGKKLPKHLNEARPEIKAKKIKINSTIESIDPIKLLSNSSINTKLKLIYLIKFVKKISQDDSQSCDGDQIQIICKYLTDNDHRVRCEVLKALRIYFKKINASTKSDNRSQFSPTLMMIMKFVSCGITHIDRNIRIDSEKLLSYLIDQHDPSMTQHLMQLFMTKITSSTFKSLDSKFYPLLKRFIIKINEQIPASISNNFEQVSIKPKEFIWNGDNGHLNILHLNDRPSLNERFSNISSFNLTFQNITQNNIDKLFFQTVKEMVIKDVKSLIGKGMQRTLSFTDSTKAITAIELTHRFKCHNELFEFWNNPAKIPHITVMHDNEHANQKQNAKQNRQIHNSQTYINRLLENFRVQFLKITNNL